MNKNIFWVVGIIVLAFVFFKGGTQSVTCIQVITPSCNPATNVIQDFPTPCDVPSGWTTDLTQCNTNSPIKRKISIQNDRTEVTLFISGSGKFGGILKENIPNGLQIQGITTTNLGIGGSATGKLTGSLYEIAFIVDNVPNPSITYILSKPQDSIAYGMDGLFEFAQGVNGGCVPNADYGTQQQEAINICSMFTTKETCVYSAGSQTQGETCKWVDVQGIIGGDKQIFKCIRKCLRPSNLCASANSIPDECGGVCNGIWAIKKRSDADLNCNNFVENAELLGSINNWVLNNPPFNDNNALLQSIGAWVKSAGCNANMEGIYTCQGD